MSNVIVFGPTGNIASAVASTAHKHGAKVYLAMRDPQKAVPGLSTEVEKEGGFERLKADMTDSESVLEAVKSSGAKRAFLYLAHGTPDHMKSTLQALKNGGVEFVVFLSSYAINGDASAVPQSELIPYAHARVEMSLDEVFGPENYVALRPGGLETNFVRFAAGIKAGEVKLFTPDFQTDAVATIDVGRVGGTILVQGARNDQRKVFLYGPQLVAQGSGSEYIGKTVGMPVKIKKGTEDEAVEDYVRAGIPEYAAEYIVRKSGDSADTDLERPFYDEGVENIYSYTGKRATTFEQWVQENKAIFSS